MNYDTTIDSDDSRDATYAERRRARLYGNENAEDERSGQRKIIAVAVIAALAIAAIVAWFVFSGTSADDDAAPAQQLPAVSVVVPGKSDVANVINATGTLTARRPMPVGSVGEGGQVSQVMVDAGDWVRAGQVLASIDRSVQSRQIQGQAAQVEVARADAQLAEANLQRALKLVDRGFISTADVDRLTATRDAARARVQVAQAQLAELRARNARLNIVAPASGLVLMRDVEPGQVVGGGSPPLFMIAKGGEMELNAQVNEADLARISVGINASVTPVGSGREFTGQVWQVSPTIEESSRQGVARIALPYDPALRPGGFASVAINAGAISAPLLPESAIQSDDDGAFVYVVGKDDRVTKRRVTTGLVTPNGIVVAEGLSGSESVVLRAGGFLNDGDKIVPRPTTRAAAN